MVHVHHPTTTTTCPHYLEIPATAPAAPSRRVRPYVRIEANLASLGLRAAQGHGVAATATGSAGAAASSALESAESAASDAAASSTDSPDSAAGRVAVSGSVLGVSGVLAAGIALGAALL